MFAERRSSRARPTLSSAPTPKSPQAGSSCALTDRSSYAGTCAPMVYIALVHGGGVRIGPVAGDRTSPAGQTTLAS